MSPLGRALVLGVVALGCPAAGVLSGVLGVAVGFVNTDHL